MTTPTSSSSNSSESIGKSHPYQVYIAPGTPTGAFEARRVGSGFYIRVDMPGVPDNAVKVVKYNETRTVTFSGKAPPFWPGFDSHEIRIYAGYVVVDRDLADVDFETHLKNGCLRMFFPCCDGSLHFLSPPSTRGVSIVQGQDEEEKGNPDVTYISHDPQNPSGIILTGGSPEHINPYLLSGVKGVYEHKNVTLDTGEQLIYLRLDVPDTSKKSTPIIQAGIMKNTIMFGAHALKKEYYSRFDDSTREYHAFLTPTCHCCEYSVITFDNASGVLRLLFSKSSNSNNLNKDVTHLRILPPSRRGGRLQWGRSRRTGNH